MCPVSAAPPGRGALLEKRDHALALVLGLEQTLELVALEAQPLRQR